MPKNQREENRTEWTVLLIKISEGEKMNFHVEPISGMKFHVRSDLQNEKNEKKRKMKKQNVSFFLSFVHSESLFWNFTHIKSSCFFIPEKCSKQKFVFCLPPCFNM